MPERLHSASIGSVSAWDFNGSRVLTVLPFGPGDLLAIGLLFAGIASIAYGSTRVAKLWAFSSYS